MKTEVLERPEAVAIDASAPAVLVTALARVGYTASEPGALAGALRGAERLVAYSMQHQIEELSVEHIDVLIHELNERMSRQLDAILHHERFQALEGGWREARQLVDEASKRWNDDGAEAVVMILDARKEELRLDLSGKGPLERTALFDLVYDPFDTLGGRPFTCIAMAYEFGYAGADVALLARLATLASWAHVPMFVNADPSMFGKDGLEGLRDAEDVKMFEGVEYAAWRAFRDSDASRYIGVCLPKYVLRLPYGPEEAPIESFDYQESAEESAQNYLWGHASVALAARTIESYLRHGWCVNIVGMRAGGAVTGLPVHTYRAFGDIQAKCPLAVAFTQRLAVALEQSGFIPLEYMLESETACFFSANSAHRIGRFSKTPEGEREEANARLGAQFPYLFLVCHFAHRLKVFDRMEIGTMMDAAEIARHKTEWLGQFVVANDADPATRAIKPLRSARVSVKAIDGKPGHYRTHIEIVPHFRIQRMDITLSLVGRLRPEKGG